MKIRLLFLFSLIYTLLMSWSVNSLSISLDSPNAAIINGSEIKLSIKDIGPLKENDVAYLTTDLSIYLELDSSCIDDQNNVIFDLNRVTTINPDDDSPSLGNLPHTSAFTLTSLSSFETTPTCTIMFVVHVNPGVRLIESTPVIYLTSSLFPPTSVSMDTMFDGILRINKDATHYDSNEVRNTPLKVRLALPSLLFPPSSSDYRCTGSESDSCAPISRPSHNTFDVVFNHLRSHSFSAEPSHLSTLMGQYLSPTFSHCMNGDTVVMEVKCHFKDGSQNICSFIVPFSENPVDLIECNLTLSQVGYISTTISLPENNYGKKLYLDPLSNENITGSKIETSTENDNEVVILHPDVNTVVVNVNMVSLFSTISIITRPGYSLCLLLSDLDEDTDMANSINTASQNNVVRTDGAWKYSPVATSEYISSSKEWKVTTGAEGNIYQLFTNTYPMSDSTYYPEMYTQRIYENVTWRLCHEPIVTKKPILVDQFSSMVRTPILPKPKIHVSATKLTTDSNYRMKIKFSDMMFYGLNEFSVKTPFVLDSNKHTSLLTVCSPSVSLGAEFKQTTSISVNVINVTTRLEGSTIILTINPSLLMFLVIDCTIYEPFQLNNDDISNVSHTASLNGFEITHDELIIVDFTKVAEPINNVSDYQLPDQPLNQKDNTHNTVNSEMRVTNTDPDSFTAIGFRLVNKQVSITIIALPLEEFTSFFSVYIAFSPQNSLQFITQNDFIKNCLLDSSSTLNIEDGTEEYTVQYYLESLGPLQTNSGVTLRNLNFKTIGNLKRPLTDPTTSITATMYLTCEIETNLSGVVFSAGILNTEEEIIYNTIPSLPIVFYDNPIFTHNLVLVNPTGKKIIGSSQDIVSLYKQPDEEMTVSKYTFEIESLLQFRSVKIYMPSGSTSGLLSNFEIDTVKSTYTVVITQIQYFQSYVEVFFNTLKYFHKTEQTLALSFDILAVIPYMSLKFKSYHHIDYEVNKQVLAIDDGSRYINMPNSFILSNPPVSLSILHPAPITLSIDNMWKEYVSPLGWTSTNQETSLTKQLTFTSTQFEADISFGNLPIDGFYILKAEVNSKTVNFPLSMYSPDTSQVFINHESLDPASTNQYPILSLENPTHKLFISVRAIDLSIVYIDYTGLPVSLVGCWSYSVDGEKGSKVEEVVHNKIAYFKLDNLSSETLEYNDYHYICQIEYTEETQKDLIYSGLVRVALESSTVAGLNLKSKQLFFNIPVVNKGNGDDDDNETTPVIPKEDIVYDTDVNIRDTPSTGLSPEVIDQLLNMYKDSVKKSGSGADPNSVYVKEQNQYSENGSFNTNVTISVNPTLDDNNELNLDIEDIKIINDDFQDILITNPDSFFNPDSSHYLNLTVVVNPPVISTKPTYCKDGCGVGCLCKIGQTCDSHKLCVTGFCSDKHVCAEPETVTPGPGTDDGDNSTTFVTVSSIVYLCISLLVFITV